jgi:methylenetetrahydrofolate reductase (NADPH)
LRSGVTLKTKKNYELVEFVKSQYNNHFHIEVAAYPEVHPESKNRQTDLQHFADKVKAGADGAITQYFYKCLAISREG